MKLTLFGSGQGSNIFNLLKSFQNDPNIQIDQIITDNPNATLIERCKNFQVQIDAISSKNLSRAEHEKMILAQIKQTPNRWLILAGYLKILSPNFISIFYDLNLKKTRILNIHPALLPAYPGLHAYERAFKENCSYSGVTIHHVDQGIDTGPIIIQKKFYRKKNDSLSSFSARGLALEHQLYPHAIRLIYQKVYQNVLLST